MSREEFSKKVKIGQYCNLYFASSIIDDMVWGFKDENCRSVKRGSETVQDGNMVWASSSANDIMWGFKCNLVFKCVKD